MSAVDRDTIKARPTSAVEFYDPPVTCRCSLLASYRLREFTNARHELLTRCDASYQGQEIPIFLLKL